MNHFRYIQEDGFQEPPYFGRQDLVGAHISVIYPEEVQQFSVATVQEKGKTIYFTPKQCKVVHMLHWEGVEEVYLIVVDAPELDEIREKYGLPKRKHEFHITVGVKPEMANAI